MRDLNGGSSSCRIINRGTRCPDNLLMRLRDAEECHAVVPPLREVSTACPRAEAMEQLRLGSQMFATFPGSLRPAPPARRRARIAAQPGERWSPDQAVAMGSRLHAPGLSPRDR